MPAHVESLEPRTLLTITFANGVVTVRATRPSNVITSGIDEEGVTIAVAENGVEREFRRADVRRINIYGGRSHDRLEANFGTPVPVRIEGLGGNDYISGGEAADTVLGGPGNDQLDGGSRGDLISGGSGTDFVNYFNRFADVRVSLDDKPNDGQDAGGFEGDNVRSDVEGVAGGHGDDLLVGGAGDNILSGNDGNDTIHGGAGNDVLDGGEGGDVLMGEGGNDVLLAVDDARDRLNGGKGYDVAQFDFDIDVLTRIEVNPLS
jgi:Ca2+-binding RTX toxin-like protein